MTDRETAELLKKAVAALEKRANAQPCDDAISRNDALNAVTMAAVRSVAIENIKLIPNTYQRPTTGRWIMPQKDDGMSKPIYYQVRCSECGFDLDPQTWHMELHQYGADKYCPNCGAKMAESEDKE